ncbi:MAG: response regulator [Patescibacteria group bacterium]|nr:response regulator [Patescibacteria group bacterium]
MTAWDLHATGIYVAIGLAAALLLVIALFTIAVARAVHRVRPPAMPSGPVHPSESAATREAQRSEAGEGAAQSGRSPAGSATGSGSGSGASQPVKPKTILIAEDDPVISLALSLRLKRLGFEVWCSPDAFHALLGSERLHPDAVILDVAMPGGDGLALCEILASDPARATMPRIVHTSHADQATRRRCRELGAHHVEKSSRSWQQIRAILEEHFGPLEEASRPAGDSESFQQDAARHAATPSFSPANAPVCGRARVTCIGPERRLGQIERQLRDLGASPLLIEDTDDGFWTCVSDKPHLIILDGDLPVNERRTLTTRLNEHPATRDLPIAILAGSEGIDGDLTTRGRILALPREPSDGDLLRELRPLIPLGPDETPIPKPAVAGDGTESSDVTESTILCIDDDPEIAYALSMRLAPYGIGVRSATSGSEGIRDSLGRTPDLILLDLKMPDGEGNYVLSRLKSHPLLEDIPVVFLTAESNPAVARQMLSLGAVGFLSKPVSWNDLFTEIGRHIELPDQLIHDYHLPDQHLLTAR